MRASAARRNRRATARTTVRVAVTLLTAGALVAGCGLGGGGHSDDSSRKDHGGSGGGRHPAAEPTGPRWNAHPGSIASLGDSITRGFDTCSLLSDCPEASWSTGTEVDSLAERLLPANARSGAGARSWNYAKTGARMADLPGQISTAVAKKPQLVTVLMGANDACRDSVDQMTSPTDYRADFTSALKDLRTSLPGAQVYVASIPDLKRLWSQGRSNPIGRTVWKLGICPSMLKDASSDDAASDKRRQQVADRVDAYNGILKDVCGKDALCRYDSAVHDYRFTTDELSTWDWFHPSKEGQRRLAAMAYRTITKD